MDIGRSLGFVFEDEDWIVKVLIGAVLALTGIGFIPILGYGLEVARRVVRGDPQPLPAWDHWDAKIIEGLLSLVISFVWSLPGILLASCIALLLVPVSNSGHGQGETLTVLVMTCVGLLVMLYSLVLAAVLPAALTHYAVTGEFGAAFRIGEIIGMVRENLGAYLMVLAIAFLAGIIGSVGSAACVIGVFFTSFYSTLITYHAYGQAYRIAVGNVESDLPAPY